MPDLRLFRVQLATVGPRGMVGQALARRRGVRLAALETCRPVVTGRRALEIGGPSAIFARDGLLPIYPLLDRVDNCDFAGETVWHGAAEEGTPFVFDEQRPAGTRLVREATALHGIADGAYDVVLASHTLEHVANPLRALEEWRRVVGPAGHLVLVLPHFANTFDHRRPVTTLAHLEEDFARGTGEDDATHVREFVELCDLGRVPERLTRDDLERRAREQLSTRTVHHHVFDTELVARLLDRAGCRVLAVATALPFHVVAVARTGRGEETNDDVLSPAAPWRRASVFRHDRATT